MEGKVIEEEGVEKPQNIVVGQRVQEVKVVLSRRMRREMTGAEAVLWNHLRRDSLGVSFRRQQIIDGFIADFYCHSAALVIEADGPIHDPDYDAERDRVFAGRGNSVLRFRNQDILERVGYILPLHSTAYREPDALSRVL